MPAVRYIVRDVDTSRDFYLRLGFELVEQWGPAIAILALDGVQLWLSGPVSSAARAMPDGRVPSFGGWNRIVVSVVGLEALYASLLAEGMVFRNAPLSGPGGVQVLLDDPDGNPVELFEAQG